MPEKIPYITHNYEHIDCAMVIRIKTYPWYSAKCCNYPRYKFSAKMSVISELTQGFAALLYKCPQIIIVNILQIFSGPKKLVNTAKYLL